MVDFKAKLVEQEWKKLGVQLVNLMDECIFKMKDQWVCHHCQKESLIGGEGEKPILMIHAYDCEVGKGQELIAAIRKRIKAKK